MKKLLLFIPVLFITVMIPAFCEAADSSREFVQLLTKGTPYPLSGKLEEGVRVVEVKASRFKFDPDPIVVQKGEKVRLVVTSSDVTHGLIIPEFAVNLQVEPGKTETAEFTVGKDGTFVARCSVYDGKGHERMRGHLIVQ